MKRITLHKFGLSILVAIVFQLAAFSQTEVKISNERVSIEGRAYYVHIVKQGETLYAISKAYHVSTETLIKENRSAVYGLHEGDALKIPVIADIQEDEEEIEKDSKKYIYHTLREGETIFALSRKYNVPEDQIKESNPEVNIFDIAIGQEIKIPRKNFREQPVYFRIDDQGYRLHKVKRGESLSDIAEKYDISVRKLRNANGKLFFPKTGSFLRIPGEQKTLIADSDIEKEEVDSLMLEDENIVRLFDGREVDYTNIDNLDESIDVILMLPLYLSENSQRSYVDSSEYNVHGKKIYKRIYRSADWVYPRSERFIEYYEGVLLAVDELRSKGLSVNMKTLDTRGDSLLVDSLMHSGVLEDADLIIGPFYSYNVDQVSRYARRERIPVVSPLANRSNNQLRNNPYLFKIQPGQEMVEEAMAEKISDLYDCNLIFVHSDTAAWNEDMSSGFKNIIFRKLRYKTILDDVQFRQVFFESRSAFNDTINIMEHAMDREKKNLVIVASDSKSVMEEVIITVHTLLKNYDIQVIGYPEMRWLNKLDPIYFYDLSVMMFTPTWLDYQQEDVKKFISNFRAKFNMEPQLESFAWESYDIAYYFMSGIAMNGSQFKYQPGRHRPDLLQSDFEFSRSGITGGFENSRLFLIQFTPDKSIIFPETEKELSWE